MSRVLSETFFYFYLMSFTIVIKWHFCKHRLRCERLYRVRGGGDQPCKIVFACNLDRRQSNKFTASKLTPCPFAVLPMSRSPIIFSNLVTQYLRPQIVHTPLGTMDLPCIGPQCYRHNQTIYLKEAFTVCYLCLVDMMELCQKANTTFSHKGVFKRCVVYKVS